MRERDQGNDPRACKSDEGEHNPLRATANRTEGPRRGRACAIGTQLLEHQCTAEEHSKRKEHDALQLANEGLRFWWLDVRGQRRDYFGLLGIRAPADARLPGRGSDGFFGGDFALGTDGGLNEEDS